MARLQRCVDKSSLSPQTGEVVLKTSSDEKITKIVPIKKDVRKVGDLFLEVQLPSLVRKIRYVRRSFLPENPFPMDEALFPRIAKLDRRLPLRRSLFLLIMGVSLIGIAVIRSVVRSGVYWGGCRGRDVDVDAADTAALEATTGLLR